MPLGPTLPFQKWLDENAQRLKPPVNNFCLYDGDDFIVMVVGGPNSRNDYHVNETEEWFFQVTGDMTLKVVEDTKVVPTSDTLPLIEGGAFRDITIREGEMFLLPANTPHNPCRYANTVGIVIERKRPPTSTDRLRWYCRSSHHDEPTVIREVTFHCVDLGTQLKPLIKEWMENEHLRICPQCGVTASAQ